MQIIVAGKYSVNVVDRACNLWFNGNGMAVDCSHGLFYYRQRRPVIDAVERVQ